MTPKSISLKISCISWTLQQIQSSSMADTETLYSLNYIAGELLNIDRKSIGEMVLRSYLAGNNMDKDESSIRNEDIRIDYNDDIKQLVLSLQSEWKQQVYEQYGVNDKNIELYWENDPNEAFWAVVHNKGESTNLHSHESHDNYARGPHVSAAFWVQVPEDSGDFVFRYKPNPYIVANKVIKAKDAGFLLFDSTMEHFVTKNCSDGFRIVISMNFKIVDV